MHGIAAGLHVDRASCPRATTSSAIREEADAGAGSRFDDDARLPADADGGPPTLMLGYAQMPEPAIRAGVRELAAAVRAARERGPGA